MATLSISRESPDSQDAQALIQELDSQLKPIYPPESRYGFSVRQLLEEKVAFFLLRQDGVPAGCGGVKCFGTEYAEVKRMYVRPAFRGQGLSKVILGHLEAYALAQGIRILRLETGALQKEAIRLYESMGFQPIPPFGDYVGGPFNLFYEKHLGSNPQDEGVLPE